MSSSRRLSVSEKDSDDLLELLADTASPAFAISDEQRIVFWNRGAEELFGRDPSEAVGRACFEVIRGRDAFGNRFCYRECPVMTTQRWGEPVTGCEFVARVGEEDTDVSVTLLQIPGRGRTTGHLLHILRPLGGAGQRTQPRHNAIAGRLPRSGQAAGGPGVRPFVNAAGNGNGNGKSKANGNGNGHAQALASEGVEPEDPPLTSREAEILRWVAAGLPNKDVAQTLGISLATVRNHIHSILEKLEVHSKLEAVSLAFRRGWVSGEPGAGESEEEDAEALEIA